MNCIQHCFDSFKLLKSLTVLKRYFWAFYILLKLQKISKTFFVLATTLPAQRTTTPFNGFGTQYMSPSTDSCKDILIFI